MTNLPLRKIIPVDMDCFFAAVELLDRPDLVGKPVAVGGDPAGRGVVSTCSYEARRFGVRSAMASARAMRLCPDLVILPPDFEKYRAVAQRIRALMRRYTGLIEPLSLDEAFLDVTRSPHCGGSASRMAQQIRQEIFAREGLTASAGVAPNKFLAKVASDWRKPNGQFVVAPHHVTAFVRQLPIGRVFGVGKVMEQRLRRLGVTTCGDLQPFPEATLVEQFGSFGGRLFHLCRGVDPRPVNPRRRRKSLSVERTFVEDLRDWQGLAARIAELHSQLQDRLRTLPADPPLDIAGLFVKVKFADFHQTTVQMTGREPQLEDYQNLCREALSRSRRAVRLLGLGVRFAANRVAAGHGSAASAGLTAPPRQRELFDSITVGE